MTMTMMVYCCCFVAWSQRFQKLYEVAEREASVEKRQLTLLHQQRVQAEMDDRKRRLLQKYVEAVDVDEQDVDVSCNFIRQRAASAEDFAGRYSLVAFVFAIHNFDKILN